MQRFYIFQACHDYLELGQAQGKRWQRMLQNEHDQRMRLEEMVEQLAKQHSSLEKKARKSMGVLPEIPGAEIPGELFSGFDLTNRSHRI